MDKIITKECTVHGETDFVLRGTGKNIRYRCKKCAVDAVTKKRIKLKNDLIIYKGGCCQICGYNKSNWSLVFHHRDPSEKDYLISAGNIKSLERLKLEADKCDLLCHNCHNEVHEELNKQKYARLV